MNSRIMIRMTEEVRKKIEEAAKGERRSVSNMVLVLIEEALEAREKRQEVRA